MPKHEMALVVEGVGGEEGRTFDLHSRAASLMESKDYATIRTWMR